MKRYIAEALGTYALVFCGTGAVVINDVSGGSITHLGIALTFGLVVTVLIYAFGAISGTHINPAVSIGFAVASERIFPKREIIPYIIAQSVGAILASLTLKMLFASHETLGATLPSGSAMQSFILEVILTYFLMLIILLISQNKAVSDYTAIAVGAMVGLEAMFAGPICGASMNPARSLAPALVSGHLEHLWIYLTATVLGAILAAVTWRFLDAPTS